MTDSEMIQAMYDEVCRLTQTVERLERAQSKIATAVDAVRSKGGMAAKLLGLD